MVVLNALSWSSVLVGITLQKELSYSAMGLFGLKDDMILFNFGERQQKEKIGWHALRPEL